jgi:hypothetical protein
LTAFGSTGYKVNENYAGEGRGGRDGGAESRGVMCANVICLSLQTLVCNFYLLLLRDLFERARTFEGVVIVVVIVVVVTVVVR